MIAILSCVVALTSVAPASTLYDFSMKNIDGKATPLSEYKGKVVMVVNVASKCGLTPQYKELEALYKEKKDAGLVILGFPANEFGNQEPGTNAEIKEFCSANYGVTFPMFEKIVVKGPQIHPLYAWLVKESGGQEIGWNFTKFLVGRDGQLVKRFPPQMTPQTKELRDAVESALAAK